jgi:hypothetical protein
MFGANRACAALVKTKAMHETCLRAFSLPINPIKIIEQQRRNSSAGPTKNIIRVSHIIVHRSIRKAMTESTPTYIGPNDVLLGRGGATNHHIGNKRYRAIVAESQEVYLAAKKKEKVVIAEAIVARVHQNGGRFLTRGSGSDEWVLVPTKRSIAKTSQALREGLDVRNHTVRARKMYRPYNASTTGDSEPQKQVEYTTSDKALQFPSAVSLQQGDYPPFMGSGISNNLLDQYVLFRALQRYQPAPIRSSDMSHVYEI